MKKMKIGIVGCGAIGRNLAQFLDKELYKKATLHALCDIDTSRALQLKDSLRRSNPVLCDMRTLIAKSELIIESSTSDVSYSIAKNSLSKGKRVLLLSIGGIVESVGELSRIAEKYGGILYLPSGAICGIDGLQAAALAGIKKVVLITRKPPQGLAGAPYIIKKGINLGKIRKETIIFEGSAFNAIQNFPKNVNVSALLSIAGIGARKTRVRIMTAPTYRRNSHEIQIESKAGTIRVVCENVAFSHNPKTSYLAALSAMVTLKSIFSPVKIGN